MVRNVFCFLTIWTAWHGLTIAQSEMPALQCNESWVGMNRKSWKIEADGERERWMVSGKGRGGCTNTKQHKNDRTALESNLEGLIRAMLNERHRAEVERRVWWDSLSTHQHPSCHASWIKKRLYAWMWKSLYDSKSDKAFKYKGSIDMNQGFDYTLSEKRYSWIVALPEQRYT